MRAVVRLAILSSIASLCHELSVSPAHALPSRAAFPAAIEEYLSKTARISDAERADLSAGKPVAKLLDADPNTEIAVFGAVWIATATRQEYVRGLSDIESFERGGPYQVTRKINNPPRAEDFSTLVLPDGDVTGLRNCRVGDCDLKLGEGSITAARTQIDWKKPTAVADANALVRSYLAALVTAYRDGGDDRLAVYRDKERPTFVAREFRTMIDGVPAFGARLPELKSYLLGYPRASLPNSTNFLYWQLAQFGVKPTIRINHVVIQEDTGRTIVAVKLLYASHYFWTALTVRALVPDPARGAGFWFLAVSRCRSDGLSGFTGKFVRGRARGEAQKGVLAQLIRTKEALEKH